MPIEATTPTVVSATYDRWTIQSITQAGDGCAPFGGVAAQQGPIILTVRLIKYRLRPDGVSERSPLPTDTVTVQLPDLYAAMSTNATLAAAFNAFVAGVMAEAQALGMNFGTLIQ